jgi:hypothetical protein
MTMNDLRATIRVAFPPLPPEELAYLRRPTPAGLRPVACRFTVEQVSLAACGCTGGVVAAVTGMFAAWVKPEADEPATPYCTWGPETLRVEFESEAMPDDGDAWARGLRERITREYPGVVAGVEADPELVLRADLDRMGATV